MRLQAIFVCVVVCAGRPCSLAAWAQESAQGSKPAAPKADKQYSGMYSFLKEGEFVQLTVEDDGRVTGFVSRYGDGDTDKEAFLDQYFRSGKLEGNKLTFVTETVHAV